MIDAMGKNPSRSRQWIQNGLDAISRSQTDLARHLGISPDKINKTIAGTRGLKDVEAQRIRAYLRMQPEEISSAYARDTEAAGIVTSGLTGDKTDLPVYASAVGGPEGMVSTFDEVAWVKRPEPLLKVKGGFGMYVIGDSMEPRYEAGDMILCHPSLPPTPGCDVMIVMPYEDGTKSCLVKCYLGGDDRRLRLRQFNPPAGQPRDFEIDRSNIEAIHVVVGKYNRR